MTPRARFAACFIGIGRQHKMKVCMLSSDSKQEDIRIIWKDVHGTNPPDDIQIVAEETNTFSLSSDDDFQMFLMMARDTYQLHPSKPLPVILCEPGQYSTPLATLFSGKTRDGDCKPNEANGVKNGNENETVPIKQEVENCDREKNLESNMSNLTLDSSQATCPIPHEHFDTTAKEKPESMEDCQVSSDQPLNMTTKRIKPANGSSEQMHSNPKSSPPRRSRNHPACLQQNVRIGRHCHGDLNEPLLYGKSHSSTTPSPNKPNNYPAHQDHHSHQSFRRNELVALHPGSEQSNAAFAHRENRNGQISHHRSPNGPTKPEKNNHRRSLRDPPTDSLVEERGKYDISKQDDVVRGLGTQQQQQQSPASAVVSHLAANGSMQPRMPVYPGVHETPLLSYNGCAVAAHQSGHVPSFPFANGLPYQQLLQFSRTLSPTSLQSFLLAWKALSEMPSVEQPINVPNASSRMTTDEFWRATLNNYAAGFVQNAQASILPEQRKRRIECPRSSPENGIGNDHWREEALIWQQRIYGQDKQFAAAPPAQSRKQSRLTSATNAAGRQPRASLQPKEAASAKTSKRMRSTGELSNIEYHHRCALEYMAMTDEEKANHTVNNAHKSHRKHLLHAVNRSPNFLTYHRNDKYDEWSSEARDIFAMCQPDQYHWRFLTLSKQGDVLCRRIMKRVQDLQQMDESEKPEWCPKAEVLELAYTRAQERLAQLNRITHSRSEAEKNKRKESLQPGEDKSETLKDCKMLHCLFQDDKISRMMLSKTLGNGLPIVNNWMVSELPHTTRNQKSEMNITSNRLRSNEMLNAARAQAEELKSQLCELWQARPHLKKRKKEFLKKLPSAARNLPDDSSTTNDEWMMQMQIQYLKQMKAVPRYESTTEHDDLQRKENKKTEVPQLQNSDAPSYTAAFRAFSLAPSYNPRMTEVANQSSEAASVASPTTQASNPPNDAQHE